MHRPPPALDRLPGEAHPQPRPGPAAAGLVRAVKSTATVAGGVATGESATSTPSATPPATGHRSVTGINPIETTATAMSSTRRAVESAGARPTMVSTTRMLTAAVAPVVTATPGPRGHGSSG